MKARNGWLFPLMVLAAGSVMVFGCIGIAAITGYLPLAKVSPTPFGEPAVARHAEPVALGLSPQPDHAVALATVPANSDGVPPAGDRPGKAAPAAKRPSPQ
jgi:hypothetical protein